ncbi:hypothetical protein KTJ89_11410 [Brevibacterium sediminis]|uniref:hypothetical protein n=1 Tax=Brevibacterium sediminis TaxID=1857024 RepID=UPI0021752DD9|nr:hypothetical protein [Brevibacterium sediminis]MCS4593589.1 hypothetical protein [Brevibacterium sediminis]
MKFAETMEEKIKFYEHRFDGAETSDDKFEVVAEAYRDLFQAVGEALIQVDAALIALGESSSRR